MAAEHHERRTEQQAEQARQQAEQEALATQRRAQQEASLARQKSEHDAELAKRKAKLAVFELQEKNRQRIEQAKLDEVAVEDLESSDDEEEADGDLLEGLFDNATNGSERTEAWVNSAGATGAVGLKPFQMSLLLRPSTTMLSRDLSRTYLMRTRLHQKVLPDLVNFPRPLNPITNLIFLKIHSRMFASMFGIETSPNQMWLQHLLRRQLRFPRLRRSWTNFFITFSRHLLPQEPNNCCHR